MAKDTTTDSTGMSYLDRLPRRVLMLDAHAPVIVVAVARNLIVGDVVFAVVAVVR